MYIDRLVVFRDVALLENHLKTFADDVTIRSGNGPINPKPLLEPKIT